MNMEFQQHLQECNNQNQRYSLLICYDSWIIMCLSVHFKPKIFLIEKYEKYNSKKNKKLYVMLCVMEFMNPKLRVFTYFHLGFSPISGTCGGL